MRKVGLAVVFFGGIALYGFALSGCAGRSADYHPGGQFNEHSHEADLWNRGKAPEDWWEAIERMHGHVGPWNVLGLRIGQAALREFDTEWGRHDLEIICYLPMRTPHTCMADGLVMGTGNCLGRLDVRLAEALSTELIYVAARRKDGKGSILVFRPRIEYLRTIRKPAADELERLSRQCMAAKESDLFKIEWITSEDTENEDS